MNNEKPILSFHHVNEYLKKEQEKMQAERPEGICPNAGEPSFLGSEFMRVCSVDYSRGSCPKSCWFLRDVWLVCPRNIPYTNLYTRNQK